MIAWKTILLSALLCRLYASQLEATSNEVTEITEATQVTAGQSQDSQTQANGSRWSLWWGKSAPTTETKTEESPSSAVVVTPSSDQQAAPRKSWWWGSSEAQPASVTESKEPVSESVKTDNPSQASSSWFGYLWRTAPKKDTKSEQTLEQLVDGTTEVKTVDETLPSETSEFTFETKQEETVESAPSETVDFAFETKQEETDGAFETTQELTYDSQVTEQALVNETSDIAFQTTQEQTLEDLIDRTLETDGESTTNQEDSKTVEVKKRPVFTVSKRNINPDLLSRVSTLESLFETRTVRINPNVEKAIKTKNFLSKKVHDASESFDSIASAAASRAKLVMKKKLKLADSEAEARNLEALKALLPENLIRENLAKEARLAAKRLEDLQFAKQASKKGDLMSSLQDVLQHRRALIDSEYSIESSNESEVTEDEKAKKTSKDKKTKKTPKKQVPIVKGQVPLPPLRDPETIKKVESKTLSRKETKRKTPSKTEKPAVAKSKPAAEAKSGDYMDELKARFNRSKKDKKSKKDKESK